MVYLTNQEEKGILFNPVEDPLCQLIQGPPKRRTTIEADMTAEEIVEIIVDRLMAAATGGAVATGQERRRPDSGFE